MGGLGSVIPSFWRGDYVLQQRPPSSLIPFDGV
jgi:hypothetical protein